MPCGPREPGVIGDAGEADAIGFLLGLARHHGDELGGHAGQLCPGPIELHGADEAMVELRALRLDPEREQVVGEPADLREDDEGDAGQHPGGGLYGEEHKAHDQRRLALTVDQPVGERAQEQEDQGHRQPARQAPDEGEQALAARRPARLLQDLWWDHDAFSVFV